MKQFRAFMSYSHEADGRLAPALEAALKSFARPFWKRRALEIYRDNAEMGATPSLWGDLEVALTDSEFFIVLASPAAALSDGVNKEIQLWLNAHGGKATSIVIVLTGGTIAWDNETGDFDWVATDALPALLSKTFGKEPKVVNVTKVGEPSLRDPGFLDAVATIASTLHNRRKSDLIGDDVTYHRQYRMARNGAIAALSVLTLAATLTAVYALREQRQAQANLSSYLDARADSIVSDDPNLSLLWSERAAAAAPSSDPRLTLLAARAAHLAARAPFFTWPLGGRHDHISLTNDWRRLLVRDGVMLTVDSVAGRQLVTLSDDRNATLEVEPIVSLRQHLIAALVNEPVQRDLPWGGRVSHLKVWSRAKLVLDQPTDITSIEPLTGVRRSLSFTPDESAVALCSHLGGSASLDVWPIVGSSAPKHVVSVDVPGALRFVTIQRTFVAQVACPQKITECAVLLEPLADAPAVSIAVAGSIESLSFDNTTSRLAICSREPRGPEDQEPFVLRVWNVSSAGARQQPGECRLYDQGIIVEEFDGDDLLSISVPHPKPPPWEHASGTPPPRYGICRMSSGQCSLQMDVADEGIEAARFVRDYHGSRLIETVTRRERGDDQKPTLMAVELFAERDIWILSMFEPLLAEVPPEDVVLSPDGRLAALIFRDRVEIHDLMREFGAEPRTSALVSAAAPIESIAMSHDGRYFLTKSGRPNTPKAWSMFDTVAGRRLWGRPVEWGDQWQRFSVDGTRVVLAGVTESGGANIRQFDSRTGRPDGAALTLKSPLISIGRFDGTLLLASWQCPDDFRFACIGTIDLRSRTQTLTVRSGDFVVTFGDDSDVIMATESAHEHLRVRDFDAPTDVATFHFVTAGGLSRDFIEALVGVAKHARVVDVQHTALTMADGSRIDLLGSGGRTRAVRASDGTPLVMPTFSDENDRRRMLPLDDPSDRRNWLFSDDGRLVAASVTLADDHLTSRFAVYDTTTGKPVSSLLWGKGSRWRGRRLLAVDGEGRVRGWNFEIDRRRDRDWLLHLGEGLTATTLSAEGWPSQTSQQSMLLDRSTLLARVDAARTRGDGLAAELAPILRPYVPPFASHER